MEKLFKIGDKVVWKHPRLGTSYEGILLTSTQESPKVFFGEGSKFYESYKLTEYTFFDWTYISVFVPKEDRVAAKCRFLWNNSNYVKKYPQQAIKT